VDDVLGPISAHVIVGDGRGFIEANAHALRDGMHHAPSAGRHVTQISSDAIYESAA
jgi:hypothetical protein